MEQSEKTQKRRMGGQTRREPGSRHRIDWLLMSSPLSVATNDKWVISWDDSCDAQKIIMTLVLIDIVSDYP